MDASFDTHKQKNHCARTFLTKRITFKQLNKNAGCYIKSCVSAPELETSDDVDNDVQSTLAHNTVHMHQYQKTLYYSIQTMLDSPTAYHMYLWKTSSISCMISQMTPSNYSFWSWPGHSWPSRRGGGESVPQPGIGFPGNSTMSGNISSYVKAFRLSFLCQHYPSRTRYIYIFF